MITKAELLDWVSGLDADDMIGIDDGGLSLVVLDSHAYFEIGGMPEGDGGAVERAGADAEAPVDPEPANPRVPGALVQYDSTVKANTTITVEPEARYKVTRFFVRVRTFGCITSEQDYATENKAREEFEKAVERHATPHDFFACSCFDCRLAYFAWCDSKPSIAWDSTKWERYNNPAVKAASAGRGFVSNGDLLACGYSVNQLRGVAT